MTASLFPAISAMRVHVNEYHPKCPYINKPRLSITGGPPKSIAKRLAIRLDSFNTVSEHTTLFEDLHDKAAHLAGADAARRHLCMCRR